MKLLRTAKQHNMLPMIVALLLFSIQENICIGQIENYRITGTVKEILVSVTEDHCICQMMQMNGLVSAFNYCHSNGTCQLFTTDAHSMIIERNSHYS
jgi:hypothetical protein